MLACIVAEWVLLGLGALVVGLKGFEPLTNRL